MRQRGFTLIEFVMTAGIVAILAATALQAYSQAAERAKLAQQLVEIGHIRTVVLDESRTRTDLQRDTRAGQAPPALGGLLPDSAFQDGRGLRLQLVHVPAGALPSVAASGSYGLVADTTEDHERLRLFQREIERAGFANAWLNERSFLFIITDAPQAGAASTAPDPAPPATTVTVPVEPAPPEAPVSGADCPPGWKPAGMSGKCRPPREQGGKP